MTLVASSPPTILATNIVDDDSDSQSRCSDDDVTTVQNYRKVGSLVQSLGYPGGDAVPPQFGQVSIENSSDVHFGDKNIYQGPVTIRQIVYANGTPVITNGDVADKSGCRENLGFEDDVLGDAGANCKDGAKPGDINCDKNDARGVGAEKDAPLLRKGLIWLQTLTNHKLVQLGLFLGILILFLVVILATVLLLRRSTATRLTYDTDEQDEIKPLEYDSDITTTSQLKNKLRMVTRIEWVAQPPINTTTPLPTPVQYVIIHHTATENCSSIGQCVLHVRLIQTFHIDSKGFYDIGYNFLVGGDGAAYEGRGWTVEGAHAFGYNSKSIGIGFIGTFISIKPPEIQILAAKKLILKGVELGYIKKDYKLLAARQLAGTESPGAALYEDIKTWPHWAKEP